VPAFAYTLSQRSEVITCPISHVTPLDQIGDLSDAKPPSLRLNPSGQKTYGQGINSESQEKLLTHSGKGENCCPCDGHESREAAWIKQANEDMSWGPGWCALCLYQKLQRLLDSIYEKTHDGAKRQDSQTAVLFPFVDDHEIKWDVAFTPTQVGDATRYMIEMANNELTRRNLPLKDPKLYKSHSNKVGVIQECAIRRYSLHEMQRISGHESERVLLQYAALLRMRETADAISDLQGPPLDLIYGIYTTRQLQVKYFESLELVKKQGLLITEMRAERHDEIEERKKLIVSLDAVSLNMNQNTGKIVTLLTNIFAAVSKGNAGHVLEVPYETASQHKQQEWTEYYDQSTNRSYWHNATTKETTWAPPPPKPPPPQQCPPPPSSSQQPPHQSQRVQVGGSGAAATVANPMVSLIMFLIKFSSL